VDSSLLTSSKPRLYYDCLRVDLDALAEALARDIEAQAS
jgi:hypothetical protein